MPTMPQPTASSAPSPAPTDDPCLWLEDVHGERALAWVRERNAQSQQLLESRPEYEPTRERLLEILNSRQRIPMVTRRGDWFYNLWQDEAHPRGLWRRTTLAEYRRAEPAWETVLDLDALGAAEQENWVWGGAASLGPDSPRCLVFLSRGGADAKVVREFDTAAKAFIEGGFFVPEAKSAVDWIDENTVFVGTDTGPGAMTDSGYPRTIRRWQRGTPLADAALVFEGEAGDVSVQAEVWRTPGFERTVFSRELDFYRSQRFLLQPDGSLRELDLPSDASHAFWNSAGAPDDTLLIELRSDWTVAGHTWRSGSLLACDAAAFLRGERAFEALFEPTATRSLAGYTTTRTRVIVDVLDNVASRLEEWQRGDGRSDRRFVRREVAAPFPGSLGVAGLHEPLLADDPLAEAYLLSYADFLTPDSLSLGHGGSDERELLKSRPAFFDAAGLTAQQHVAVSRDGTRIPYFQVGPNGLALDGNHPTLLYGYGGFEIALTPSYSGTVGSAWLERGGVYVLANIRGGGEFGPAWHQAATREHKQRSYDDFAAVAEHLIARGVTTPRRLGIQGGSNGGLLMGAMFTQRPELFSAVVCQVPLLDMRRYHRLLAGASWMAEYGDPDRAVEWAWISAYSPYQNLRPGVRYPRVFFTTSTRDDRVHPGHARKMAARMLEQGHEVLYYENIEGGHGGAADNAQRAHLQALEFSYLWLQLGGEAAATAGVAP